MHRGIWGDTGLRHNRQVGQAETDRELRQGQAAGQAFICERLSSMTGLGRRKAAYQWQGQADEKAWAGSCRSEARTGSRTGLDRQRAVGQRQEQAEGQVWAGRQLLVGGKNRQQIFVVEENRGLIVIGTFYFNWALISWALCSMQQVTSFKYQRDLHVFPENQRFKNEMIIMPTTGYLHRILFN